MKMAAISFFSQGRKNTEGKCEFLHRGHYHFSGKKKLIIGINLSHVIIVLLDHPQINITISYQSHLL